MQYDNKTLKYYDKLDNIGSFDKSLDDSIGTGIVGSPLCGDVMKLQLLFNENDVIVDAKCKVFGCVSAIASMEYTCDALKGKSIPDALALTNEEVADSLSLTPIKRHCSVLAKEAVQAAVGNYIKKKAGVSDAVAINLTENAMQKIEQLVSENQQDCIGIAIDIQNGGCSGVEYYLSYQTMDDADAKKYVEINGIKFFYIEESEPLIHNLNIDITESDFGYSFLISNPNKGTGTCDNCTCKCY